MELTQSQKKYILKKYKELKNDEQTLGETLDLIVEVWDYLEDINSI